MKRKSILFADVGKAEYVEQDMLPMGEEIVKVRMEYTVVSAGTERANIMAMPTALENCFPLHLASP